MDYKIVINKAKQVAWDATKVGILSGVSGKLVSRLAVYEVRSIPKSTTFIQCASAGIITEIVIHTVDALWMHRYGKPTSCEEAVIPVLGMAIGSIGSVVLITGVSIPTAILLIAMGLGEEHALNQLAVWTYDRFLRRV